MMALSMMLMLIGGIIGGQGGIVIALILVLVINLGAYWFSDRITLGKTKSQAMFREGRPRVEQHGSGSGTPLRSADAKGV